MGIGIDNELQAKIDRIKEVQNKWPENGVEQTGPGNGSVQSRENGYAKIIELTKDLECDIPFDVLPKKMQFTIEEWAKAFPLPPEYYFGGALAAFSAFIGNSVKIEYKPGWIEPASLYMALVGPSSIGKTPALQKILTPIIRKEIRFNEQYREDLKRYAILKQEAKQNKEDPPEEPLQRQITIQDFTTEVIAPLLIANPNGLIATADELMGLIKNFGRYSNGSDLEFWLSVWANQPAKVNRVTRGTLFVKRAFVTIIGGIQNKIVNELAAGTNVDNGFTARILFVLPAEFNTPELTDYSANMDVISQYYNAANFLFEQIENRFLDLRKENNYVCGTKVNPGKMQMTPDAQNRYKEYYNEISRRMNKASTEWERSALGKLRSYCLRFSLILRLMDAAFNEEQIRKEGDETETDLPCINISLDLATLERAIRVCSYFEGTMTAIVERVTGRKEENIIKDMPESSRELYISLPDEFKTGEGVEKAKEHGMSERTFKRMLKDESLFTCVTRGHYRKNIIVDSGTSDTSDTNEGKELKTSFL